MDALIGGLLSGLKMGEGVEHGGVRMMPLFVEGDQGPEYLTLGEAVAAGDLIVTEMDGGASVPELTAVNVGDLPVLVLDGEELRGAKQNRVLNTTILIAPRTDVVIPVSCTEEGRWQHVSEEFSDSEVVASRGVRRRANRSVSESLAMHGAYRSDQGGIWEEVADLSNRAAVDSSTSAMRDVFAKYETELSDVSKRFPLSEGQNGLLVMIGGEVAGMDVVSRPEAYAKLHEKLVRSYAMESLVVGAAAANDPALAKAFVTELGSASAAAYPSPGLGESVRFTGDACVGSALVLDGALLHAAFFAEESQASVGEHMAGRSRRAMYRRAR